MQKINREFLVVIATILITAFLQQNPSVAFFLHENNLEWVKETAIYVAIFVVAGVGLLEGKDDSREGIKQGTLKGAGFLLDTIEKKYKIDIPADKEAAFLLHAYRFMNGDADLYIEESLEGDTNIITFKTVV